MQNQVIHGHLCFMVKPQPIEFTPRCEPQPNECHCRRCECACCLRHARTAQPAQQPSSGSRDVRMS